MNRLLVQHQVQFFRCLLHLVEHQIKIEVCFDSIHFLFKEKTSLGMAFSPMTFTTSPAQSNICPSGRTPMSTPSRARSDLGSARKLRLVNEHDELVSVFIERFSKQNLNSKFRKVILMLIQLIIRLLFGVLMFMSMIVNVDLYHF